MKDIQGALDLAIMKHETAQTSKRNGYIVDKGGPTERKYDGYLNEAQWVAYKKCMERHYPKAFEHFSKGGGKELDERTIGNRLCPPKMASFGSSSRMTYELLREYEKKGFLFEKKLHTTIGGTANLDGFMETVDTCYFIEAKCREPYASYEGVMVSETYRGLYDALKTVQCTWDDEKTRTVTRKTKDGEKTTKETNVTFSVGNTKIGHFDMKQMICHLLGIATAYLKGKYDKNISFIYLMYNPTDLSFDDAVCGEKILEIHAEICAYPFMRDNGALFGKLFYEILRYLQTQKHLGESLDAQAIAGKFSFCLCDQNNIVNQFPTL